MEKERKLESSREHEEELEGILASRQNPRYDSLRNDFQNRLAGAGERRQQEINRLVELRTGYLRTGTFRLPQRTTTHIRSCYAI